MLQETEIKKLLEDTFDQLFPGEMLAKGRENYAKMRIHRAERKTACGENLYQRARGILTEKDTVLEDEPGRRLLVMTGSGMDRRNPTLVEMEFEEDSLSLTAWAKEGFIPQRSAPGAVKFMLAALGL